MSSTVSPNTNSTCCNPTGQTLYCTNDPTTRVFAEDADSLICASCAASLGVELIQHAAQNGQDIKLIFKNIMTGMVANAKDSNKI